MAGGYGLRLTPLHGGGLRFEVASPEGSATTDLPYRKDVMQAVVAVLGVSGVTRAIFEDGALTAVEWS